jgi:hypothetical protein
MIELSGECSLGFIHVLSNIIFQPTMFSHGVLILWCTKNFEKLSFKLNLSQLQQLFHGFLLRLLLAGSAKVAVE